MILIDIVLCLYLAMRGIWIFAFIPLSEPMLSPFSLVADGLLILTAFIVALSLLRKPRASCALVLIYVATTIPLYWKYEFPGHIVWSDFSWLVVPDVVFAACVFIKALYVHRHQNIVSKPYPLQ